MSKEKDAVISQLKEILKKNNLFTVLDIENVNHKPHPFTIGPAHMVHASDHHGGRLGEETMKAVGCKHGNCHVSYEEHTSDKILFLQLTRNTTPDEANPELIGLRPLLIEHKIDGIGMIETKEGFRVEDEE